MRTAHQPSSSLLVCRHQSAGLVAAPQPCDFGIGGVVARHQRRVHAVKEFVEVGSGVGRGIRSRLVLILCAKELLSNLSVTSPLARQI